MGQNSTTHLANAYRETIFVKVDSERFHVTKLNSSAQLVNGKCQVGGSLAMDMVWNKFIEAGFCKIPPGEFAPFSPIARRVFVTIWSPSQGYIWNNAEQKEDLSFIVKAAANGEASVVKAKYGTIWQSSRGVNLKP